MITFMVMRNWINSSLLVVVNLMYKRVRVQRFYRERTRKVAPYISWQCFEWIGKMGHNMHKKVSFHSNGFSIIVNQHDLIYLIT